MGKGSVTNNRKTLIVMPAKDEEQGIREVLKSIKTEYPAFDTLVVDDGSSDNTADIAKESGALLVSHGENKGVVAAIQTGRDYALSQGYDFIVFCDADGQHNPLDIGTILSPLLNGEADFVIGSRELGDYVGTEPLRTKLARTFCSIAISLLARKHITDPTSGFKGWNRMLIAHFTEVYGSSDKLHLSTTNDMEEILIARKKGARIKEVPVTMFARQSGGGIYTKSSLFHFFTIFPRHLIRTIRRNLW